MPEGIAKPIKRLAGISVWAEPLRLRCGMPHAQSDAPNLMPGQFRGLVTRAP